MPVDKSAHRIREMFSEIAGRYDFLNHLLSLGIDRYWRWRTVRLVPPGEGPVLDVCTGTGDLALGYWRAGRKQTPVVGADFAHPMLVLGRKKAHRAGAGSWVRFVEADAQMTPFADGKFSVVSVAFGLRNVSDTDRGLREMARVCRPGGQVAVLEFSIPTAAPWRKLYGWYFRNLLPRLGQALSGSRHSAYNYLPTSVSEFPQGEALAERMQQAGLSRVRFYRLSLGIATLYVGEK